MKKKILIIGAGAVAAGIIGTVIAKVVKNHNKKYISSYKGYPEDDSEDDFDYLEDDDDEIEEYLEEIIRDLEDRSAQLKKDVKVIAFEKKGE